MPELVSASDSSTVELVRNVTKRSTAGNVEFPERAPDLGAQRQRCLRLMVVDDHELYRMGIRTLLEQEGYKVVEAPSGEVALRLARSFRPDVVVMDVHMPGTSGIEATRMLLTEHPRLTVLMLTVTAEDESILDALRAGAFGYLLKDAPTSEIVAGIEAAAAGHSAISPRVASTLVRTVRSAPAPSSAIASVPALSERERTVLALIADGYENAQIAHRLYLSLSTVRNLVSRVFEKLGVDNRVQAATFAVRHGLADIALDS
jgi:two-component system, NarL family, nitrate/nitrite response regulator NarL